MLGARLHIIVSCLVLISSGPPAAASRGIEVRVNGRPLHFDAVPPQTVEGRVMVPLRGVLERMGAKVEWDSNDQSLAASRGGRDLYLPVGSRLAQVEGRPVILEAPAVIIRGTTLVPLRFVAESMGAEVKWDYRTQTVHISTISRFVHEPGQRRGAARRSPRTPLA